MIPFSDGWEFTENWSAAFARGEGAAEQVRLPHTVKEVPLHAIDEKSYQMISGYRKRFTLPAGGRDRRFFLQFDAAGHIATVYVNGMELATHRCGYTAFRVEFTEAARLTGENLVAVKLDSTENPAVPPFGFVIDYLTYGGLYRPAHLDITGPDRIEDVFVTTPDLHSAVVRVTLDMKTPNADRTVHVRILDAAGNAVAEGAGEDESEILLGVPEAKAWDLEHPHLYRCEVTLPGKDVKTVAFGFRTAEFRADGFYLNGQKTFLRGLNRHQCWPYVGYAAPDSMQAEDARILKEELACTAVRTSHYPQSQAFIDACDRLGLLVFTEIPGWQHIGDENWKQQACENTREMVMQYRNHPSIVLWGVRINESQDDDEFYAETNRIAHELDDSRPTSGVRYIEKSHLLEDVYAFNDFSHTGGNPGCKPKKAVTKEADKGFLISEHSGHMFPTKPYDPWMKRQEHALRHARVQNDALADGEHAGCFGWCMFDYATHKDFGSGDRVCYHGVLDAFRNPKTAAAVYASQGGEKPVLEIGSSMDIGDYPGGNIGPVWVFTNADEVRLYKNDQFVKAFAGSPCDRLPHGPVAIDDTIGELLQSQEGFRGGKEKLLHRCLLSAGKYGMAAMPLPDKLRMGWAMLRYGLKYSDGVALYGKYVGNWGGTVTVWRFEAVKDGRVVATRTLGADAHLHLEATASSRTLHDGETWDMAAVRIRICDRWGNIFPYAQLPLRFGLTGAAQLIGPDVATAEGGMGGTYIRTVGQAGQATLTIAADGLEPVTVDFTVVKE